MRNLDFFVDLMTTGTVLGVDHTSDLAAVEEVLGHDSTFEVSPSGMISDFGLVEFGWHRGGPPEDWAVTYFGAQTHRLSWLTQRPREVGIETALVDHYGRFRPRLDFDELRASVHTRGFTLEELPSLNDGCSEYWEPTSRMGLITVSDPDESGVDEPAGTVLKMLGPQGTNRWAWHRFRGRTESFKSYATHLLTLSETERLSWLDRREPKRTPSGPTGGDSCAVWSLAVPAAPPRRTHSGGGSASLSTATRPSEASTLRTRPPSPWSFHWPTLTPTPTTSAWRTSCPRWTRRWGIGWPPRRPSLKPRACAPTGHSTRPASGCPAG